MHFRGGEPTVHTWPQTACLLTDMSITSVILLSGCVGCCAGVRIVIHCLEDLANDEISVPIVTGRIIGGPHQGESASGKQHKPQVCVPEGYLQGDVDSNSICFVMFIRTSISTFLVALRLVALRLVP